MCSKEKIKSIDGQIVPNSKFDAKKINEIEFQKLQICSKIGLLHILYLEDPSSVLRAHVN